MNILFISRAYPPIVGGIENQNYELSQWLPRHSETTTITSTKGKKALPFFLPWMMLKLPFIARRYDVILFGDAVLAILGWWIKLFFPQKKCVSVVHGLDLTFTLSLYQNFWVKKFIPCLDKLIAVGNQTITEGVIRGIPKEHFTFVPNGIDPSKFAERTESKDALWDVIGTHHKGKKTILTSGRLAKRKGAAWFVRTVLPQLSEDTIYIIAGDGPDRQNIETAIRETNMQSRVILLGYVTNDVRNTLFQTCDLFVQPNITVKGDMEGFGISVIEASTSGITLIASNLEGLKDAISDGNNGFLVEHENPTAWTAKVTELLGNSFDRDAFGRTARAYNIEHLSWDKIAKQYVETLEKL